MITTMILPAYKAGAMRADEGKHLTQDAVRSYCAEFFGTLCQKIRPTALQKYKDEKEYFDKLDQFKKSHQENILHDVVNKILSDNNIPPISKASEIELSVQTSFIKGYLEHQKSSFNFDISLTVRGGPQHICEWIYSLVQVELNKSTYNNSMTHNSLLQRYFQLNSAYSFHALFYRQNNNLTEEPSLANDSFYTGYRKNGTTYVYYVDDNICDNQEVTGGSYASVKYFANSETHEVHHLIPAKLLKMTGILDFLECPCIRMEINDHAKTRSYKNRNMLNEEFFQVQLEYLKSGNIRAAVEMELTDIQAIFKQNLVLNMMMPSMKPGNILPNLKKS